jgi:hypothetical protein
LRHVVGATEEAARDAAFSVAAQRRRLTQLDGAHYAPLDAAEVAVMRAAIGLAAVAEDIRHSRPADMVWPDDADVGAALQEMGGEAVAQCMHCHVLGHAGCGTGRAAGRMQYLHIDRLRLVPAREEPVLWPREPPVGAQDAEQLRRQLTWRSLPPLPCSTRITIRAPSTSPTIVRRALLGGPGPSEPRGHGPQGNTGELASSWLHPLRSWSLRETRRGSTLSDGSPSLSAHPTPAVAG